MVVVMEAEDDAVLRDPLAVPPPPQAINRTRADATRAVNIIRELRFIFGSSCCATLLRSDWAKSSRLGPGKDFQLLWMQLSGPE
jgi:hypothetical protein